MKNVALCYAVCYGGHQRERERTQRSTTDLGRRQFSCLQVHTSAAASCMVT